MARCRVQFWQLSDENDKSQIWALATLLILLLAGDCQAWASARSREGLRRPTANRFSDLNHHARGKIGSYDEA